MLVEIIIISFLSLLILFFRKGSLDFSNMDVEIKGYKILVFMAVIKVTAMFLYKTYYGIFLFKVLSMNWIIYFAILYISLLNMNKSYMKLFLIGSLLNFIAIALNDFRMPVYIAETYSSYETIAFLKSNGDLIHSFMTDSTKVKLLCDIITIPPPYPFPKTISIGDIFLLLGFFIFWQNSSKNNSKNDNTSE